MQVHIDSPGRIRNNNELQ